MIDTWERAVRLQATLATGLRLAPQARTDPKTLPASSRPGGARRGKSDAARTQLPFSDWESLTACWLKLSRRRENAIRASCCILRRERNIKLTNFLDGRFIT